MQQLSQISQISSAFPWHDAEWNKFILQLRQDSLPHALMLVGPQYIGKSQLALAMARRLLCKQINGTHNCGACHACELSASGNHGDFLWVEPEEKGRVIKIGQIRNLVRFGQKTATYGLRKVIVISPVGSMNLNAFNALLKSLEEPVGDTFFILVCHGLDGIPMTIRSRCHTLHLTKPDYQTSVAWLDSYTQRREESETLLALGDSLPLLAREIYITGTADVVTQRRKILDALCTGKINLVEASTHWDAMDIPAFLEDLTTELQRRALGLSTQQLKNGIGHATFELLSEITKIRRAVNAGANPNKQMLIISVLSRLNRYLGVSIDGSILARHREGSA